MFASRLHAWKARPRCQPTRVRHNRCSCDEHPRALRRTFSFVSRSCWWRNSPFLDFSGDATMDWAFKYAVRPAVAPADLNCAVGRMPTFFWQKKYSVLNCANKNAEEQRVTPHVCKDGMVVRVEIESVWPVKTATEIRTSRGRPSGETNARCGTPETCPERRRLPPETASWTWH
jgi:hypothetical protein